MQNNDNKPMIVLQWAQMVEMQICTSLYSIKSYINSHNICSDEAELTNVLRVELLDRV